MSALRPLLLFLALYTAAAVAAPERFTYRVLEKRPQPRENFVQGLEIVDGRLLVGTGLYGASRLLRYDFASMRLLDERRLPGGVFGEGITQFGDRIYQLTWRARAGIVYRASDLVPLRSFALPGEGWGLTHDDRHLIYSDGSDTLHFLDPVSLRRRRSVTVSLRGSPLPFLNELEWIDGRIWANVWRTDRIVIIDPETGRVDGEIDLTGLLPAAERRPGTDVLNGIAHDPVDGAVWVTGKRWPWLYRIEPVPAADRAGARE
jgi:glutamine cyclotransferase